ncbi:MAG: hypothetical protein WC877_00345 [Dehalococcoidales bacterium]|jgi:hypothetical protein
MKASELIESLNYLINTYGDLSVFTEHENNDQIYVITLPDIGFIISKDGSP